MAGEFEITDNVLEMIGKFESVKEGMSGVGIEMRKRIAQRIIDLLPSNMNWKNGSGRLAGSFSFDGQRVGSDLPYAHRREFSFHGPDSLGRMFPNDPAAWFMRDTLQQVTTDGSINSTFSAVMSELAGGGA